MKSVNVAASLQESKIDVLFSVCHLQVIYITSAIKKKRKEINHEIQQQRKYCFS